LSHPEIASHKKSKVMERFNNQYAKRSQKDYSMLFKLSAVSEVERGELSATAQKRNMVSRETPRVSNGCENMVPLTGEINFLVICPEINSIRSSY
jgi:hypothetical protein